MDLTQKDGNALENSEDIGHAVVTMIGENLDLNRWGFDLAYKKFVKASNIKVVYRSEQCKIKFMFARQQLPQYDELSILYGRLHAPDEDPIMKWENQDCYCWHHILDPLRFLDGLSPHEAMEQVKIHRQLPMIMRDFRDSEHGKDLLAEYPPRSAIVMQSILWAHYGQRLFELFDLRKPELWQEYRDYLREYYRLLGEKSSFGPPLENVC